MITTILRILLGLLFIVSAALKCYPIEFFELVIQDTIYPSAAFAVYLSRLVIGIEFFLGWVLIFGWRARMWLFVSFILLLGFTIQNLILLVNQGNEGNCGCFGMFLRFTPLQSIGKNLILLFINGFVWFFSGFDISVKWKKVTSLIGSLLMALPFVLFPVHWYLPEINTDAVEEEFPVKIEILNLDSQQLQNGKQLLAFFSTTCLHCIKASYALDIVSQTQETPEITAFFVGPKEELPNFFKQSNSKPKHFYIDEGIIPKPDIIKITNGRFPVIYYVENGLVIKVWRGDEISTDNISNFFNTHLTKN